MPEKVGKVDKGASLECDFAQLIRKKLAFFEEILGREEFDRISASGSEQLGTFDLNPNFVSPSDLSKFWDQILATFHTADRDLEVQLQESAQERAVSLIQDMLVPSDDLCLVVLVVGCYHTAVYNRPDVVQAAEELLKKSSPDRFLLITACSEEVMYEQKGPRQYENRFLDLVTSATYRDLVFPIVLPERPEFHFSGRLCKSAAQVGGRTAVLGFEPHHNEDDDVRIKVRSTEPKSFMLAFSAFIKYVTDPSRCHDCREGRSTNQYKKYLPQYFRYYRQYPPYSRGQMELAFNFAKKETH